MINVGLQVLRHLPLLFGQVGSAPPPISIDNRPCNNPGFFGFPTWYQYLKSVTQPNKFVGGNNMICTPVIEGINDILLIGAAVVDMLLRVAALVAVGMVMYGGYRYITSQAEPDKLKTARGTIINGIIGLVIAISATAVVTFVAGQFRA